MKSNLPFYAEKCLKIRSKDGTIQPLLFNRAQRYIHDKLEQQLGEQKHVRALILKGRQQGCSTYVGARLYHKVTHSFGTRAFILTHEDSATQNLFEMVERYHDNLPDMLRPTTGANNAKELSFPLLEGSGYKVGTAGSKGVGRSSTIQLFHGSECAFWPNADTHAAGILQAVPLGNGTEIILESTAMGVGNFFHEAWRQAEKKKGDFQAIFVPWFWQPEYTRDVPIGFKPTTEEEELQDVYNLDLGQIVWRRFKIDELKSELLFNQEYPNNAQEAFVVTNHDSFIRGELIMRARKFVCEGVGPLVIGVDPARFGDDRFAIARRKGRKVYGIETKSDVDNVAGANWVRQIIDAEKPAKVFIDVGGVGGGVVDILKSWGDPYARVTVAINFGGSPQDDYELLPSGEKRPGPKNRRAEMWKRSRDWLDDPAGVDIPDDDAVSSDACGPGFSYDVNQRLVLESKEHMKARGIRSSDIWDAVCLTFAEPIVVPRKPYIMPRINDGLHSQSWMG